MGEGEENGGKTGSTCLHADEGAVGIVDCAID